MKNKDRLKAYKICKERGHSPDDLILTSSPPQNICKHCGTRYRYETKLIEFDVPKDPDYEVGGKHNYF